MRIALLCYDLSSNALGRAHVLAQACEGFAQVTIWGPRTGPVWAPLAARPGLEELRLRRRPRLGRDLRAAADRIARSADVVFASKPLTTSYGLARRVREGHGVPVVLDIDDWERGFLEAGGVRWKILADGVRRWREPNSYYPTLRLERFARHERWKTVSNRFLQERFGGVLVPHGRDARVWDPDRVSMNAMKARFGVKGRRVVLFFGSPRPHKGIDLLVEAVAGLREQDVACVIVGSRPGDVHAERLRAKAPDTVVLVGEQPFADAPQVVAMADVVAIPQRRSPGSIGQMPAKVYDAMAMGKAILSTDVGDIGRTLEGCGLVVQPDSAEALRDGLRLLLGDDGLRARLAKAARARFLREFTTDAMAKTLRPIFAEALASRPARTV